MKKEYQIKDIVWIHNGEKNLIQGRIVEIINFSHLNENYDPSKPFYIIELETGIDNIYEVRPFEQISPDKHGPIMLFRKEGIIESNRLLKHIGMPLPQGVATVDLITKPKKRYHKQKSPKRS